jgi:hypothetical protein
MPVESDDRMFTLDQVVPWGRSFDEYCRMFAVTERDLTGGILGCADGPASFNAEATRRGCHVVSCDPLYAFSNSEIRERIAATSHVILDETRRNAHEFVWTWITSPDELVRVRMMAMNLFLDDFDTGQRERRYIKAELPTLPFDDGAFDLALCSHFLFLYADQLDADFHRAATRELCRVAREVRVFPLLALGGARSSHVAVVANALSQDGHRVSVERVDYEFQRGGNEMMRVVTAR